MELYLLTCFVRVFFLARREQSVGGYVGWCPTPHKSGQHLLSSWLLKGK